MNLDRGCIFGWWMGHYSKRTWFPNCICVIVFAVKDTHTLACSFVLCEYLYCFLLGSRQVTWLPCLSLCSWLISSIAYLSKCMNVCERVWKLDSFAAIFWELFESNVCSPNGQTSPCRGRKCDVCMCMCVSNCLAVFVRIRLRCRLLESEHILATLLNSTELIEN